MSKKNITVTDIILPIISVIIALGTAFIFHACGAKEDGSFMNCHWAERVVIGLGILMTFLSCAHLFTRSSQAKMGLNLSLAAVSVFTALVPGVIIKLCMMKDMRCHTVMRPAVTVLCAVMFVACIINIFIHNKKGSNQNVDQTAV